jgi:hypothetical protein
MRVTHVGSLGRHFMINRHVNILRLAVMLLLGISGMACIHNANDGRHGAGSFNARQRGYEFAYRDGADRGRLDRARTNPAYEFDSDDYRKGDGGYTRSMGDRGRYQQGYREGYKAGYDDAYRGRSGQKESRD